MNNFSCILHMRQKIIIFSVCLSLITFSKQSSSTIKIIRQTQGNHFSELKPHERCKNCVKWGNMSLLKICDHKLQRLFKHTDTMTSESFQLHARPLAFCVHNSDPDTSLKNQSLHRSCSLIPKTFNKFREF